MKAASEVIPGACGVANLFNYASYYESEISWLKPQGGAGWVFASFVVGNKTSEMAYAEMYARWPVVYKSPVRLNKNSGNEFYFVIFDCINDEHGWDDDDDEE